MFDEAKLIRAGQMGNILNAAGDQVVDCDDLVAFLEQAIAKVRADEPGPSGDDDSQWNLLMPGSGLRACATYGVQSTAAAWPSPVTGWAAPLPACTIHRSP